ncbi:MAG: hypothetical protein GVY13_03490 [Alphaproteobacteria bacterium]|jgi:hypothetical protein|nr:hypothetical protein [Alphaproteobacteria bacterium]
MHDWNGFVDAASRPENGHIPPLRAPYNFVSLNRDVLPTPLGCTPDLSMPVPDAISGTLTVEWAAETPLLVGGQLEEAPGTEDDGRQSRGGPADPARGRKMSKPFTLGGSLDYAIPGASLRGMIRAVLEIAAYGRLNFFDDSLFGVRNFDDVTWQAKVAPKKDEFPSGGFLKRGKDRSGERAEFLTPCSAFKVDISHICSLLGVGYDEWHRMPLVKRRRELHRKTVRGPDGRPTPLTQPVDAGELLGAGFEGRPALLVVAGAAIRDDKQGTNKKYEMVFLLDTMGEPVRLLPATVQRFRDIQVADGNEHRGDPDASWSYWRPVLDQESGGGRDWLAFETHALEKGIPVFWRNERGQEQRVPTEQSFLSLTRFMRVPYEHSVRKVAKWTQSDLNKDEPLDLVEALFGWAPPEAEEPAEGRLARKRAWRSRVKFGIATLPDGVRAETLDPVTGVTMKPRASFFPFYLRPDPQGKGTKHPVDYDNRNAVLAGRKRYPARNGSAERLPQAVDATRQEQLSDLTFLKASRERPLTFRSTIKVHNVTPVELGALVWALTFGQHGGADRGRRHMLGRAKAYGYGQVRATIADHSLTAVLTPDRAVDPAACMAAFQTWVTDSLPAEKAAGSPYEALPEIRELCAMAHAPTGEQLRNHLKFTRHQSGRNAPEMTLKAYQRIKQLATQRHAKNGDRREDTVPGFGKESVADHGREDAFLRLPCYPFDE